MIKRFIRLLVFIWLILTALIGLAARVGYLLPGGTLLIYSKPSDRNSSQLSSLYLLDTDSRAEALLTDPRGFNASAKWSPNGRQIAYLSLKDLRFELYTMDSLGQNKRHIPLKFTAITDGRWSPDSQRILYSITYQDLTKSVLVNSLTGQIDTLPQAIPLGVWSPDGQTIIYKAPAEDRKYHLYGMNISCFKYNNCEFKELALLTNQSIYNVPTWSPDGQFMAFGTYNGGNAKINVASLHCADLIDACVDQYQIIGESSYLIDPIWSPDSQQLAFVASDSAIDVVQVSNGERRSFTVSNGMPFVQSWSPDGKFIFYLASQPFLSGFLLNVVSGEINPVDPRFMSGATLEWRPVPH